VDGVGRGAGLFVDGPPADGLGRGADPDGCGFEPDVLGLRGAGAGAGRGLGFGAALGALPPDELEVDGFELLEPLRDELEPEERPDEDGRADPFPLGAAAWIFSRRSAGFASAA
jgi:hypothetical protein